ncbi:hypothetical protein GCM10009841_17590 [Microlunatus panaciterrae]|uniref:Uncharacterized protein n=1 Tax=Microlunatus panaciterrae TaxID=400768 RepID=A0ABS2RNL8_9ACTN|nr:hypothetical protein [Microlunatus panaciterrae]MBM7800318.1 hypothetical protein [Microlunatus panaciterrae]
MLCQSRSPFITTVTLPEAGAGVFDGVLLGRPAADGVRLFDEDWAGGVRAGGVWPGADWAADGDGFGADVRAPGSGIVPQPTRVASSATAQT